MNGKVIMDVVRQSGQPVGPFASGLEVRPKGPLTVVYAQLIQPVPGNPIRHYETLMGSKDLD